MHHGTHYLYLPPSDSYLYVSFLLVKCKSVVIATISQLVTGWGRKMLVYPIQWRMPSIV